MSRSAILRDLCHVYFRELRANSLAILALLECEPALSRAVAQDLFAAADAVRDIELRRTARPLNSPNDFLRQELPGMPRSSAEDNALPLKSPEPASAQLPPEEAQPHDQLSPRTEAQSPLRTQAPTSFGGPRYLVHIGVA